MKKLTAAEIQTELLDDDLFVYDDEWSYVMDILINGRKGYKNMTKKELVAEYESRLGEKVELVELIRQKVKI